MKVARGQLGAAAHLLVETPAGWVDVGHLVEDTIAACHQFDSRAPELADLPPIASPPDAWLPPVSNPSKLLAVGRNYAEHAREQSVPVPEEPLIFSILPSAMIGHLQPICLPTASRQIDFEAELVVVIGKQGHAIPESDALQYVAGYMCGNDVTARDWQKGKPGGQWLLGKSFDSFAPVGPYLVSAASIPDPQQLDIRTWLNGQLMQSSNTCHQMFTVSQLIAYLSQVCTLLPGDLLFTGTPAGVGVARDPQVFLQPGDVVEVEIEGLGKLTNPVIAQ